MIFFGREQVVDQLVDVITSTSSAARIAVLGGPGIGKTSVALAVLHSSVVVASFGSRRFFIACDAAETPGALPGLVAAYLGVSAATATQILLGANLTGSQGCTTQLKG